MNTRKKQKLLNLIKEYKSSKILNQGKDVDIKEKIKIVLNLIKKFQKKHDIKFAYKIRDNKLYADGQLQEILYDGYVYIDYSALQKQFGIPFKHGKNFGESLKDDIDEQLEKVNSFIEPVTPSIFMFA